MDGVDGKVALVVGGTAGIGLSTAEAFVRAGAMVVVAGRSAAAGEAAVGLLTRSGGSARYLPADVQDPDSVSRMVSTVVAEYGRLDIAFNNAGWDGPATPTADIDEADWLGMVNTKLSGVWRCMKYELRQMTRQDGGGAVVNMAGNWGLVGFPGYSSYCAAAHGIMGLTKAAAKEYARQGIRINSVCPGAVRSPMLDRMVGGDEGLVEVFGDGVAAGRVATPEEVANAVLWLSSAAASYVNGAGLVLDGGG
ncbi:SDR family NAD(P)-dependent oxidoreductase [Pseudonocardia asaccharolytica]|uniref:SDR family NAD(P)-dependent oxidoreductase n=1 Tax=Pseudonocardia asaccharolytica TaxID=54010 RepID=UPI00056B5EB9|nr:SDR family oxidoreductase [Pseudonocardia asaccharolytica]